MSEIDRQVRAGFFPNADSLARELGVSKRVIFKDRAFIIERLRAPLTTDWRRGGWYYTDLTWTLPNIQVTQGELLALFISVECMRCGPTAPQVDAHSSVQRAPDAGR
ncbi:MAG: hypothetical protein ACUVR3_11475 [Candidatus Roseilinea sp.]|uniref:hypothetical protein n=1 Tax=Candidatus Roseilinea sp. TaxID=2838777 RepID=UPI004049916E